MFNKNKNLISFVFLSLTLFAFSTILIIPKSADASYIGWQNGNYVYCYNGDPINGCGNGSSFGTGNGYGNNTTNPIPAIYSVSPSSSNLNWNNTTVTITGSNFIASSVVQFNYSERPTTYVNSGTLQVQLNSYDLTNVGTFPITVFNGGPGGGMSNSVSFNVTNRKITNTSGTTTSRTNKTSATTKTTSSNNSDTTTSTSTDNGNSLSANALFASNGFVPANFLQWLFVLILILLIVFLWRKIYVTEEDRRIPLKHA